MSLSQLLPIFDSNSWCKGNSFLKLSKFKEGLTIVAEVANPKIKSRRLLQSIFFLSILCIDHLHPICASQRGRFLSDGETNQGTMHHFEVVMELVWLEINVFDQIKDCEDFLLPLLQVKVLIDGSEFIDRIREGPSLRLGY